MEMLCKWNGNLCLNRLQQKARNTSEGRPFVSENFHLASAYHFYFNPFAVYTIFKSYLVNKFLDTGGISEDDA